ncbi:MAG: hypothetical protein G3I11_03355 [Ferrovum sp.]|nr:hypothetical protein [Ferrovum sp.]
MDTFCCSDNWSLLIKTSGESLLSGPGVKGNELGSIWSIGGPVCGVDESSAHTARK